MAIVGFDLGKRKSQLCIKMEDGREVDLRISTDRSALSLAFAKIGGKCRVLIEASTSSEWVARHLEELGHDVIVADPNFTPMYARADKKIKTDKRDARALVEALRLGAFRPVVRRDDDNIHLTASLAVRDKLVRSRTGLINQLKAILERWGYRPRASGAAYVVDAVREMELDKIVKQGIEPLLVVIEQITKQIKNAEKPLKRAVANDDNLKAMDEIVGIGTITALAFTTTLVDPSRFYDAGQVTAYLGLVPRESSSGEKRVQGGITKAGNRVTRSLLVEAASCIMKSDKANVASLRRWALDIATRRGKSRAVVALARRLARILFAMWRDNSRYQPDHHLARGA